MAVIGIDMDGTIADFTSLAIENVNRIWNLNFKLEDMVEPRIGQFTYDALPEIEQKKYKNPYNIYRDICPPGFFFDIKPFPGAVEAVKKIAELGHEIVFITKPLEWFNCPGEKHQWLQKYFSNINYRVMLVDSMEAKGLINIDVMIDDDPRTIESLDRSKVVPILIKQPWNQNFRS